MWCGLGGPTDADTVVCGHRGVACLDKDDEPFTHKRGGCHSAALAGRSMDLLQMHGNLSTPHDAASDCPHRPEVEQAIKQQDFSALEQLLPDEAERNQALASCGLGPLLLSDWLHDLSEEVEVRGSTYNMPDAGCKPAYPFAPGEGLRWI